MCYACNSEMFILFIIIDKKKRSEYTLTCLFVKFSQASVSLIILLWDEVGPVTKCGKYWNHMYLSLFMLILYIIIAATL